MMPPFEAFQSIPRLNKAGCVVTEKIDGTNAQVFITDDGEVFAGSRTRWITPEADNYGFARWVVENKVELQKLGPGQHFGEWWGSGIQRRYGMNEKRFSLFNSARWADDRHVRPACCHVVPVLYAGPFDTTRIDVALKLLADGGSVAAPGYMNPEGIIVYHTASHSLFKKTLDGDGHKGAK